MKLADFIENEITEHLLAGRFKKAYFLEELLSKYQEGKRHE